MAMGDPTLQAMDREAGVPARPEPAWWHRVRGYAATAPGAFYALAIMSLVLSVWTRGFLTVANLTNVGLQVVVLMIVALGMTLIILTEGIDLSLGPVLGLAGVVMGLIITSGWPLALAMIAALGVGAAFGLLNGVLVSNLEMPPFVVTLGTFGMAQSLAMVLTEGNSVTGLRASIRWFNEGVVLGVPVPLWTGALLFALTYLLLYHTKFGRYVFAIGGNRQALILAGVRVRLYQTGVYVYGGLLAAVAAFIMTARMNAAHPTIAIGLEFDAIASVILGGTSFEKGKGGIGGTVVGALAVGVLRNGLNLIGLSTEWQVAVVGVVIILAIVLDSLRGLA
jgi:ribose transport system permease protein